MLCTLENQTKKQIGIPDNLTKQCSISCREPLPLNQLKTPNSDTWKYIFAYLSPIELGAIQLVAKSHFLWVEEFIEETVDSYDHLLLPRMMWINHHGRPLYVPVWKQKLCIEENCRRLMSKPVALYPYQIFRQILLQQKPDCLRVLDCCLQHPTVAYSKIRSRTKVTAGQNFIASEKTLISGGNYKAQFDLSGDQYYGSFIGIARPLPAWDQEHFLLRTGPEFPFRFIPVGGDAVSIYPQEWLSCASINVVLYQISESFQQVNWYIGDEEKRHRKQVGVRHNPPSSILLELNLCDQCNGELIIINTDGSRTKLVDGLKGNYVWAAVLCSPNINKNNATTTVQMKEITNSEIKKEKNNANEQSVV